MEYPSGLSVAGKTKRTEKPEATRDRGRWTWEGATGIWLKPLKKIGLDSGQYLHTEAKVPLIKSAMNFWASLEVPYFFQAGKVSW